MLPVLLFGIAALLNSVTMILGYFSQLAYANGRQAVEVSDRVSAAAFEKEHDRWQTLAITLVVASLVASSAGMTTALYQIEHPACAVPSQGTVSNAPLQHH